MPTGIYVRKRPTDKPVAARHLKVFVERLLCLGLSRRAVARVFGVSHTTVQRLLTGEWNPGRVPARAQGSPTVAQVNPRFTKQE